MSDDYSMQRQLPYDFPWEQTVALLLDAFQVKDLLRRLYEWNPLPQVSVLYQGTQWADLSHVSPCLVRVCDRDDPVLSQFLTHSRGLWGYVVVSDRPWDELLLHLRWLTSFQPPQGKEMFLRISDPAVAQALFAIEHGAGLEVFGPCQEVLIANAALDEWMPIKRPGDKVVAQYANPFRANDAQWDALKSVAYSKSMSRLYSHMQRFFPDYLSQLTAEQRLEHIYQLACSAAGKGFESEQEIYLYANVFGSLGDGVLEQHPDIAQLLKVRSRAATLQRVTAAAALATQRSQLSAPQHVG